MENLGYFITFEGIDGSGKSTQAQLLYEHLLKEGNKVYLTREIGGTPFGEEVRNLIIKFQDASTQSTPIQNPSAQYTQSQQPGEDQVKQQDKAYQKTYNTGALNNHQEEDQNIGEISNLTKTLAIMAARSEHLDKIILKKLREGYIVICDRFIESTAVYQSEDELAPKEDISENGTEEEPASSSILSIYLLHQALFDVWPDLTILMDISANTALDRIKSRMENNSFDRFDENKRENLISKYRKIQLEYPERIIKIDANQTISQSHESIKEIVTMRMEKAKSDMSERQSAQDT